MALCTSAAATDESTPPLTAARTRSPPTCARMRATLSSMMEAGVQSGAQPQISTAKCLSSSAPLGVCLTSGWNCTAKYLRVKSPMAAMGLLPDFARATNPAGMRVIRSPCDIQTLEMASSMVPGIERLDLGRPILALAAMGRPRRRGCGSATACRSTCQGWAVRIRERKAAGSARLRRRPRPGRRRG